MTMPLGLAFSFLLSAVCWFFVFNKPARRKYLRHHYERDEMTEEGQPVNDAVRYAFLLVLALAFSVAFLVCLVAAIARLFG